MLSATLRRAPRLAARRLPRHGGGGGGGDGDDPQFHRAGERHLRERARRDGAGADVDGVFGILHNHVPTIAELKPGVVSITETEGATPKEYFVSGGFASSAPRASRPPPPSLSAHPPPRPRAVDANSVLNISALEAVPVEDLDAEAVKVGLAQYTDAAASAKDDVEKAEAEIGVEVYSAMSFAITKA